VLECRLNAIKQMVSIRNLKKFYIGCMLALVLLIIFTPTLITDGVSIIDEETLESIIIAFLFALGFILNSIYEKELESRENHLKEAWAHIGEINLLTEAFKDAFIHVEKYPESKKEMRELLVVMTEKILNIVNCPFAMLRILLPDEVKTLTEYYQSRNGSKDFEIKISNKQLIENESDDKHEIIASSTKNTKIKAYCIFPKTKINQEQKIFIQKIVNDLAMLYIIFNSEFYKN
jgi:hypothetical protein